MYCCEPQELVSEWKRRTCLRNHILIPSMFGVLRFSEWGRLQQLSRNFEDDIRTPCRPRDSQYVNVRQQNLQWIWRRKNKHEDVWLELPHLLSCVWVYFIPLVFQKRAIFTGGLGALEKKASNRVPPGSTTWVKSPPLRKDHELAHALDQSLVSRCSSVLTDASESKVWWGG